MTEQRVGFVGAGQMGRALAVGFVEAGLVRGNRLSVYDPSRDATERLSAAIPDATWYQVWVNTGGADYTNKWVNGATNWTFSAPFPDGSYIWWVRGWDGSATGPWSAGLPFTLP